MSKKLLLPLMLALALGQSVNAQETVSILGSGDLQIKFDGRVTMDAAVYLPNDDLEGTRYEQDQFRFSNAANITQTRLGIWAQYGERWSAKFDVDYSNRRVNLADIIAQYRINAKSYLMMGYYKDPVSMEANMSSKFLSVQTPMAVNTLTRGERYLGITYVNYSQHHWFEGGLYAGTVGSRLTQANRGDDGYGIASKIAILPTNNEQTTLYLGLSGRWRRPEPSDLTPSGNRAMGYLALPESTIDRHSFVGFAINNVRSYLLTGTEVAFKHHKFYFTGESLYTRLFREGEDHSLWGWTLTGSYMLKGGQRKYLNHLGMFNPLAGVPKGGALELIGRIGQLDLNDSNADNPLNGGKATSYMLGLNWYPNANILVACNYTYMDNDKHANAWGSISQLPACGIDFHTLQLRLQFLF